MALTVPAIGRAHVDFLGGAATSPPPRQLVVTLQGSGHGSWKGTEVYYSVEDSSPLAVQRSGQISYHWKSVKPLSFMIPPYRDKAFDVTAQGDLTGSWQTSDSGTKVDSSGARVEPFSCNDKHDDIPTPVNAELSYQPSAGHAVLTLYPDAFFFPSVPVDCHVIFTESNVTASGGIIAQNLFQSPDAQANLVLPSTFVTVPKAATVNFPRERIDTQSGSATEHIVNDGTVAVNPCGGFGNAVVTFVQGDASSSGEPLAVGSEVSDGAMIATKGRTRVEIRMPDKSVVRIGPQSKIDLTCAVFGKSAEDRKVSAKLVVGDLWAKIAHAVGGDAKFEVETQNAVNGVRGTIFTVTYRGGTTVVHAIQDTVWTRGIRSGKTTVVKAPMCAKVVGGNAPTNPYPC
jgi:hypothetical protein